MADSAHYISSTLLCLMLSTCTSCIQQLPHSCHWDMHAVTPAQHDLRSPAANAQGGLLPLEKSEASKRAAARAKRERAALREGLKNPNTTGILAVAALTAGAMVVAQVLQDQGHLMDALCLYVSPLPSGVKRQPLSPVWPSAVCQ